MATCAECDGIGGFVRCVVGHEGGCPCPAISRECEACHGMGRRCDFCREPLPLSVPADESVCGGCVAQIEAEDEEEQWQVLGLGRETRT